MFETDDNYWYIDTEESFGGVFMLKRDLDLKEFVLAWRATKVADIKGGTLWHSKHLIQQDLDSTPYADVIEPKRLAP